MFLPRLSSLVLLASALLSRPFAFAQTSSANIIPDTLPACAKTCPLLQQALTSCEANPAAAATCFCQSALLAPLKTSNANVCAGTCADADFGTINSWFKQYCANPANPAGGGGQTTTGATTTPTTPTGTTTTTAPANQAANAAAATSSDPSYLDNADINKPESGSQWWSNHWQWVLMVIILFVAFMILGIGGRIWWRRRQRRREGWDEPRPEMAAWAPNRHSVHDFGSHGGTMAAGAAAGTPAAAHQGRGKGKARATTTTQQEPASQPQPPQSSKGGKLKKVLGRG